MIVDARLAGLEQGAHTPAQRFSEALTQLFLQLGDPFLAVAAGVGKSTLAKGRLHWLQQTHGLSSADDRTLFAGVIWFDFDDISSTDSVINQPGDAPVWRRRLGRNPG